MDAIKKSRKLYIHIYATNLARNGPAYKFPMYVSHCRRDSVGHLGVIKYEDKSSGKRRDVADFGVA